MDIIYEISYLLTEGIDKLQQTDMEYRKTRQLEDRILEQLNEAVGKDTSRAVLSWFCAWTDC